MASFLQQHLGATLDIVDIDGKRFVSVLDRSEYRLTKDTARLLDQALRLCVEGFRVRENDWSSYPLWLCRGPFIRSLRCASYVLVAWPSDV